MEINADFSQRVLIHSETLDWTPSPMAGVDRRMLDRIGDEVARATSIVRYAPGSHFAPHTHDGGEEFIVLEGVFQDEHGDYPAGTYVRNPPTTRHRPGSEQGCVIFVKLWQFDPADRYQMSIDMATPELTPVNDGIASAILFEDARETVRLEQWDAGNMLTMDFPGGAEILIIGGSLIADTDAMIRHDWLRIPPMGEAHLKAGPDGARFWVKTGHLASLIADIHS
jgi:quercetin dioxygenase-like cupin family protein